MGFYDIGMAYYSSLEIVRVVICVANEFLEAQRECSVYIFAGMSRSLCSRTIRIEYWFFHAGR